jgi:hypothetical protein
MALQQPLAALCHDIADDDALGIVAVDDGHAAEAGVMPDLFDEQPCACVAGVSQLE